MSGYKPVERHQRCPVCHKRHQVDGVGYMMQHHNPGHSQPCSGSGQPGPHIARLLAQHVPVADVREVLLGLATFLVLVDNSKGVQVALKPLRLVSRPDDQSDWDDCPIPGEGGSNWILPHSTVKQVLRHCVISGAWSSDPETMAWLAGPEGDGGAGCVVQVPGGHQYLLRETKDWGTPFWNYWSHYGFIPGARQAFFALAEAHPELLEGTALVVHRQTPEQAAAADPGHILAGD